MEVTLEHEDLRMDIANTLFSAVKSKDELPPPLMGLIALDLEQTKNGVTFLWVVEDGEWVSRQYAEPPCQCCGRFR